LVILMNLITMSIKISIFSKSGLCDQLSVS
jgi:hypothetical protein